MPCTVDVMFQGQLEVSVTIGLGILHQAYLNSVEYSFLFHVEYRIPLLHRVPDMTLNCDVELHVRHLMGNYIMTDIEVKLDPYQMCYETPHARYVIWNILELHTR